MIAVMQTSEIKREHNHITLSGALTVKTARELFNQTPQFDGEELNVNLDGIREVDSAGLALLLHWSNMANAASSNLTFTNPPTQLREIAKIMGLETLFVG